MTRPILVVKVGGSLYDLPDLGARLRRWLAEHGAGSDVVLVPGGGAAADVVRDLDRRHALGEEAAHWLALRALAVNAHFLAALLPPACVFAGISGVRSLREGWQRGILPVLDVHKFALYDEKREGHLPHRWAVTSDSFAARVAVVFGARRLVLLKSTSLPDGVDWEEAGRRGLVDETFAAVLRQAPTDLQVSFVNFREG